MLSGGIFSLGKLLKMGDLCYELFFLKRDIYTYSLGKLSTICYLVKKTKFENMNLFWTKIQVHLIPRSCWLFKYPGAKSRTRSICMMRQEPRLWAEAAQMHLALMGFSISPYSPQSKELGKMWKVNWSVGLLPSGLPNTTPPPTAKQNPLSACELNSWLFLWDSTVTIRTIFFSFFETP